MAKDKAGDNLQFTKLQTDLNMKYVVVSGGVVSGLGKGVTISSLGRMLRGCGLRVTSIKIDPYLNVDAGTMSPFEHGEVSMKYLFRRSMPLS